MSKTVYYFGMAVICGALIANSIISSIPVGLKIVLTVALFASGITIAQIYEITNFSLRTRKHVKELREMMEKANKKI